MNSTAIVIVVAVVVVVAAAVLAVTRGRRMRLRRTFGPEFDRIATERGDPKIAEQELAEREREYRALELRPLADPDRARFTGAWSDAQEAFIDDPQAAVLQAEEIISNLLAELGYPARDRDQQLILVSVDHAEGLSEYRQGLDLAHVNPAADGDIGGGAQTSTESMRQAMRHYRVFFEDILGGSRQNATS